MLPLAKKETLVHSVLHGWAPEERNRKALALLSGDHEFTATHEAKLDCGLLMEGGAYSFLLTLPITVSQSWASVSSFR